MLRCLNTSLGISSLLSICPSGGVDFLQTIKAPDTNCSNLLITTKEGLILLQGQDLEPRWTLEIQNISRLPTGNIFLSFLFLHCFLLFTFKCMCSLESNQEKLSKRVWKFKSWRHMGTLMHKEGKWSKEQKAQNL